MVEYCFSRLGKSWITLLLLWLGLVTMEKSTGRGAAGTGGLAFLLATWVVQPRRSRCRNVLYGRRR
ncbi:hypothetical protein NC651_007320 [Populus alba x Populus x berolinensis]|nr:hypothetical protein NC651_007320 [Populus alba x Populus x berolinensis]